MRAFRVMVEMPECILPLQFPVVMYLGSCAKRFLHRIFDALIGLYDRWLSLFFLRKLAYLTLKGF